MAETNPSGAPFGYSLGSLLGVGDVLECARALRQYRPDSIWIPESWGAENFAMLSAVSQVLTRPRIGSSIVNIYSRSPSLVAMGAATLDLLSRGRLILGLGASTSKIVDGLHGGSFQSPVARMREYMDIIRIATSGARIDYSGRFFRLKGFSLMVRPHQRRIPIYLAAVNRQMLNLAWEDADGIILYLRPLSELRDTIPRMQERRRITVCCQIITAVSDDAEAARDRARKTLAFYVSVGQIYRGFLARCGFASETEGVLDGYKRSGLEGAAPAVTDGMLDALTVCGTPDECVKKMLAFRGAGIDIPIIQFNPVGGALDSMRTVARTFSAAG